MNLSPLRVAQKITWNAREWVISERRQVDGSPLDDWLHLLAVDGYGATWLRVDELSCTVCSVNEVVSDCEVDSVCESCCHHAEVESDHITALAQELGLNRTDVMCMTCSEISAALELRPGHKVMYAAARGGVVLGIIVRSAYRVPLMGWYVDVRVTSRSAPSYPCSLIEAIRVTDPWLPPRFGRYAR